MAKMNQYEWHDVLVKMGARQTTADKWVDYFTDLVQPEAFSLGDREIPFFLGQVFTETGRLEHLEEDLRYSAGGLMRTWPSRFPTLASTGPYVMNSEALANKVYGGRLGNVIPGDGWKYRGSGCIMTTGRDNYRKVAQITGIDVIDKPELLREPRAALQSALIYWEKRVKDSNIGNLTGVAQDVNGGQNGIEDRRIYTNRAFAALKG